MILNDYLSRNDRGFLSVPEVCKSITFYSLNKKSLRLGRIKITKTNRLETLKAWQFLYKLCVFIKLNLQKRLKKSS